MNVCVACVLGVLLLSSSVAHAQVVPMIRAEEGEPLIRNPEIVIPDAGPDDLVVFRVIDFQLDAADIPFFIDRTGIVVPPAVAEEVIPSLLSGYRVALYVCSFGAGERPNLLLPQERARYCEVRRQ